MIVDVDDDIEMRWCWCWQCRWDECMLCMYMRGLVTYMNIPGEGRGFGLKVRDKICQIKNLGVKFAKN